MHRTVENTFKQTIQEIRATAERVRAPLEAERDVLLGRLEIIERKSILTGQILQSIERYFEE
jgi:hypothetical protein